MRVLMRILRACIGSSCCSDEGFVGAAGICEVRWRDAIGTAGEDAGATSGGTFASLYSYHKQNEMLEAFMDAKYNYIIDSMKWRILLNVTGFALWLAASAALLRAAA